MERVSIFEELRLIERSESEVNGAWKGAHLLLFFMAFVFGSFCTFCFHMLMYLFDEKCVLFPKLLSLTSLRHNVIYEFLPVDKETADMLPLDFLGPQWMEKSACYLPTYVPLISGIFGLVWTTMFLMCSTGSRTLTGLQRPWRVLPPVFVFSLAMGIICIYSSTVTHNGLDELCLKLGEITGSPTCTYTVNVATLAYERRIRGVYQAIRLTIFSAWLHTICWLLSALLTLARVILAVDFQLVRVKVDLIGDIDKIMDRHEKQIRTVSPDLWYNNERTSTTSLPARYKRRVFNQTDAPGEEVEVLYKENSDVLYRTNLNHDVTSEISLHPDESAKLARMAAYSKAPKEHHFIVKMVYDLVTDMLVSESLESLTSSGSDIRAIVRQLGLQSLQTKEKQAKKSRAANEKEAEDIARKIRYKLRLYAHDPVASTSRSGSTYVAKRNYDPSAHESVENITDEMKKIIETKAAQKIEDTKAMVSDKGRKSNLKNSAAQTDERRTTKVQIAEPEEADTTGTNTKQDIDKETQTKKDKEKQD